MKRLLLILPLALLAALLISLAAGWWALHDRNGSAWLLRQAARLLPGELAFELEDGSLASGLAFASLEYGDGGLSLRLRELRLAIGWRELAARRVRIQRVAAADVVVTLADAAQNGDQTPVLPDIVLPFEVALDSLALGRLTLTLPGITEELSDIRLAARHSAAGLHIRTLALAVRGLQLQLSGDAQTSGGWPMRLQLAWQLPAAGIEADGQLEGDLRRLQIEQQLRLPDRMVLRAELRQLLTAPEVDLLATWDRLVLPVAALQGWRLGGGSLRLTGGLDDWQAELGSEFQPPSGAPGRLAATLGGDRERLRVRRLRADWARAVLNGSGEVRLPALAGDFRLAATGVDPQLVAPGLRGSIDLAGRLAIEPGQSLDAVVDSLTGELFGHRLTGRARVRWRPGEWQVPALELQAGDNRLSVSGTWAASSVLSGRGKLDAAALDQLWPGLAGRLAGSFELGGSPDRPVGKLQLDGQALRWQNWAIAGLAMAGSLQDESLNVELDGAGLAFGQYALGQLHLAAGGRLDGFALSLALADGPVNLALDGEGAWQRARWSLIFESGTLTSRAAGQWTLDRSLAIGVAAGELALRAHCWRSGDAGLCLEDTSVAPGRLSIGGQLQDLPLSLFRPWLVAGLRFEGTANAEFRLQRDTTGTAINLQWRQGETRLQYRAESAELLETRIEQLSLDARGDAAGLRIDGRLSGERKLEVRLAGHVLEPFSADPTLALSLDARLPELAALEPVARRFFPVQALRGQVDGRLEIGGHWRAPRLAGQLSLSGGAARLPAAGIELEQLALQLSGRGDEPLSLSGEATSGGGRLQIDGHLDWSANTGLYADLQVGGHDFQALRFPDQSVYISPQLRALVDGGRIIVSGELLVPRAEIRLDELPANARKPSDDIVVHAADSQRRQPREQLALVGSVRVLLGKEVYFSGFGLDARLVGELMLTQPPGDLPAVAQGQLRTQNGRFKLAGKELEVERGLLIFAGPIDRPSLDVRAVRRIDWEGQEINAGILLSGPSDAIKTRVFAEPPMSEADALSFLVLDRPVSAMQTGGSGELSNTALALGLLRVLPIAQQLEQGLGLDEVALEGSGGENTSLVAGKRIGRDVFIRYRYGLFNRIGTFLVRYRIGRGFSIEAGSGEQQSLELVYSIDR